MPDNDTAADWTTTTATMGANQGVPAHSCRPPLLSAIAVTLCVTLASATNSAAHEMPTDSNEAPERPAVVHYGYKIVQSYPHDRRAFTQGLVYEDKCLYEGTGLYGQSAIARRDLDTGKALKMLRLPRRYFGEGITIFGDKLIQLTWRSRKGFVYTKDTFTPKGGFTYPTEGWGITHDGHRLILSNGTSTLRLLDPNTYAETDRIEVRDRGRPVRYLNELEYINGLIYANVWPTGYIVLVEPKTGRVTGWIDLRSLYTPPTREQGNWVLNGIAYIPERKHLLVTGKCWPRIYEIELVRRPPSLP